MLKLKSTLISKGYTEIINILNENDDFYVYSFSTSADNKKEIEDFVLEYISSHNLSAIITLRCTTDSAFSFFKWN